MTAKVAEKVETEKVETEAEPVFETKSARIRYLASKGMKTADIARLMGIRYQHVRNTLERPLKKVEEAPKA